MPSQLRPIAAGNRVWVPSTSGNASKTMARQKSAMATVAMSSTMRGRWNRRFTTVTSVTRPRRAPTVSERTRAGQNGHPQLIISSANSVAPGRPMLPTAKLMTRVDR